MPLRADLEEPEHGLAGLFAELVVLTLAHKRQSVLYPVSLACDQVDSSAFQSNAEPDRHQE